MEYIDSLPAKNIAITVFLIFFLTLLFQTYYLDKILNLIDIIMKTKFYFILLSLLVPNFLFSQNEDFAKRYLFEQFENGKVTYIDGSFSKGTFNYDTTLEKLLFISDNNTVLEMANPQEVTSVLIGDRSFIRVKKSAFYEVVDTNGFPLYVEWKSNVVKGGKKAAYGGISNTHSGTTLDQLSFYGEVMKLNAGDENVYITKNKYYVFLKNRFQQFKSFDELAKLFKDNEVDIKEYVKSENLNFSNIKDVQQAVQYSGQFKNK